MKNKARFEAKAELEEVLRSISIIARGIGALGYTIQRPTEDRYLMTGAPGVVQQVVMAGAGSTARAGMAVVKA